MRKSFSIGGIVIALELYKDFTVDSIMNVFAVRNTTPDVSIRFTRWDPSLLAASASVGKDIQFKYFCENGKVQAQKMHGSLGYCTVVRFAKDYSDVECSLLYPDDDYTAMMLFQHIPMKIIYAAFNIMLLHSSQIAVGDKSILFTAPSGTGKTTQSNLWSKTQGAQQLSGDRSASRIDGSRVWSYGFPLDGSNPVFTNSPHELGAIVVLRQAQENSVERLKGTASFRYLLEQASVPYWNRELINRATETLYVVLSVVPTYLLRCTPDTGAVECLKNQLIKDGIIR
ncbi:MAG TPA: hypothetical protein PLT66_03975 [Bacillota bacterium]|nr:hypothetical protein [Bacillota bacterium]